MKNTRVSFALLCGLLLSVSCRKPPQAPGHMAQGVGFEAPVEEGDSFGEGDLEVQPQPTASTLDLTCEDDAQRGLRSLRKLSNIELTNTITDIFGTISGLDTSEFSEDIQKSSGGYDNVMVEANFVDDRRLGGYIKLGASVAAKVDITKLFPCASQGASCFKSTLPALATTAWRRPATTEELANLQAYGTQLIADGMKAEEAARALVQALIVSRGFLYRTELGVKTSSGDYELTDWETASALSYMILRRPPDAELKGLAEKGGLRTAAVLKAQAERLLALPAAKTSWAEFADMWLVPTAVTSHETKVAQFTPAVRASLVKETKDFFVSTLFDSKGTFDLLLTADYTVAGSDLQWLYGGAAKSGQIKFGDSYRRGLLGQGSFLASHATDVSSSPVTRGAYVLKKLLCSDFIGAPPTPPASGVAANLSGREFRKTTQACASCHVTIDPVGYTFKTFDMVGRYRDKDEMGTMIDTTNTLQIDGKDVTYDGAAELSKAIAKSNQGLECMSRQMFRFGMGRMERAKLNVVGATKAYVATKEGERDACYIQSMTKAMKAKDGNLKEGILALVTNPAFRLRSEVKTAP